MNIIDAIKNSVLEQFNGSISVEMILISLLVSFVISLFIVFVYKKTFSGVVYNKTIVMTIVMIAMVTSMVIRTINSNLSLYLGMVGALSIVRFRTAVKEPVDTGFMFWGIAAGIMAGAGLYIPAMVATLGIGVLYFLSYLMGFKTSNRYLLVIKYKASAHETVLKKLKTIKKFKIRSKAIFGSEVELSLEVDVKENKKGGIDTALVDQFNGIDGVVNASLIAYQNDFGS